MLSIKNLTKLNSSVINKIAIVAFSLCTSSLVPSAVLSQTEGEANDPVAIYKQAGINADQESSIRKMAQDYDQENSVKLQSLAQMLQDLRDMAYQKNLNEPGMLAKQEEINKLQSDMALQRIKLVIKIRALLTPAQNEKLVAALQSRVRGEEQTKLK
jgi:Spy/CpxP family protein refolding chaperone